jgi:P-type Ca2+ transporter type 2C
MDKMPITMEKPWHISGNQALAALETDSKKGLTDDEANKRRIRFGSNTLTQAKKTTSFEILIRQFKSLIVLLLAAAAVAAYAFGEIMDGSAIVVVILLNAAIGFITEIKAVRSMEALNKLSDVTVRIVRDDKTMETHAAQLVPGDIVLVEGGDIISADMRIFEQSKLQVNESALTGESMPVDKQLDPLDEEIVLAERLNMLFKGTQILRGSAKAVVTSTGMSTELGTISSLVEETDDVTTPLERKLHQLGNKLIWITLGIAVLVGLIGVLTGKEVLLMIETAIALAVAAIPEGLPIVATLALARGMWRMAKRNALINHLAAVETLGATSIICTDKTGTLTENRMTVQHVVTFENEFLTDALSPDNPVPDSVEEALRIGVLCNNATISDSDTSGSGGSGGSGGTGDPIEIAILAAGRNAGIERDDLTKKVPEIREDAFDAVSKMMATFHKNGDKIYVAAKGAPEAIIKSCSSYRSGDGSLPLDEQTIQQWTAKNEKIAEQGLRVLAIATKNAASVDEDPYTGLELIGFLSFLDPPREDVKVAIDDCRKAGIRVIMITGDQAKTAATIALKVGLADADDLEIVHARDWKDPELLTEEERQKVLSGTVFSRFSPKQKMDLIEMHQQNGSIVAMTGDGVNDAPALKKANIGIAMGLRGTQVAREASDMVLKDDAFATIVKAVEQGRIIFDNIRKFITYLLSCNLSEIAIVAFASFLTIPLPILPLQILFLNLVTDIFPALALGVGEGDPTAMQRSPRSPQEGLLTRKQWITIGGYSLLMSLAVLGALFIALFALKMGDRQAVSISFLTLAFSQLWHVFNMSDPDSRLFRNDVTKNPYIWGALALCTLLLIAAVYLPGLSTVLKVTDPGWKGWLVVAGMSLSPYVVAQVARLIKR